MPVAAVLGGGNAPPKRASRAARIAAKSVAAIVQKLFG